MVALGVLAIALVALLTLRNRDLALQAESRHLVTATALAKMKMEEMSRVPGARDGSQSSDFGERYPGYQWTGGVEPAPLTGWLQLRVEVTWPAGRGRDRVELVTYVKENDE